LIKLLSDLVDLIFSPINALFPGPVKDPATTDTSRYDDLPPSKLEPLPAPVAEARPIPLKDLLLDPGQVHVCATPAEIPLAPNSWGGSPGLLEMSERGY